GEVGRAREDVLAQRPAARRGRPLVVEGDTGALLEGELAALERDLSREGAQERGLAGPVRAGERQAVPALDLERDAVEERVSGELLAEGGGDDDGHGSLQNTAYAARSAAQDAPRQRRARAARPRGLRDSDHDARPGEPHRGRALAVRAGDRAGEP